MLHDIGKLVILIKLSKKYEMIIKHQSSIIKPITEVEEEMLGFDHAHVGDLVMKHWGMP